MRKIEERPLVRVLGIDPGTDTLGTCVCDVDRHKHILYVIHAETYNATKLNRHTHHFNYEEQTQPARFHRMARLAECVYNLTMTFKPDTVGIESPFMRRITAGSYGPLVECCYLVKNAILMASPYMNITDIPPTQAKATLGVSKKAKGKDPVRDALSILIDQGKVVGVEIDDIDEHTVDAIAMVWNKLCLWDDFTNGRT